MDENWHKQFLSTLASVQRPGCYLELGLSTSPALLTLSGFCLSVHGVDPAGIQFDVPTNATIHAMTTNEFFAGPAKMIPPPNLVFVDADHRSHQVMRDLEGIASIAAENCIVAIHDTFPPDDLHKEDHYCSDSYRVPKIMIWERVTLPFPPGLTLCRMHPRSLV